MNSSIEVADASGEDLIGLVGEPSFYERFGFTPAAGVGIEAPEAEWQAFFQVLRLGNHPGVVGRFEYPAPFYEL